MIRKGKRSIRQERKEVERRMARLEEKRKKDDLILEDTANYVVRST